MPDTPQQTRTRREIAHQKLTHTRTRYDAALRDYMGALTAFEEAFNDPFKTPDKRSQPSGKIATNA